MSKGEKNSFAIDQWALKLTCNVSLSFTEICKTKKHFLISSRGTYTRWHNEILAFCLFTEAKQKQKCHVA